MFDFDGLDTSVGLAATSRREHVYRRLLIKYRERGEDFAERAHGYLSTGDLKTLGREAHDLRSTSGALGALGIVPVAFALEEGIARGAQLGELGVLIENLGRVLAPLVEQLRALG